MPGLSLICDFKNNLNPNEARITRSLKSMVHSEFYQHDVLYHDNSCFLGLTRYNEYPFTIFQSQKYSIYLEGKIYDKKDSILKNELENLVEKIINGSSNSKKTIREWLLDTDGDFIVFALENNTKKFIAFNDALGRLPLYYQKTPNGICISRETRFITNLSNNITFDKMSIAQNLLFGYPLGTRTLVENINRLLPATIISIDFQESKIYFENIFTFNFDEKRNKSIPIKTIAEKLVNLFLEATKNRTHYCEKNIISLSGGFDSRSVAAAMHKQRISFTAVTFSNASLRQIHEAKIAEKLADIFSIPWRMFYVDSDTKRYERELLKIKNGLNYLGMSFILPFFKWIKMSYGNDLCYFTGDGGDKTLHDLNPESKIIDLDELINYIINKNYHFTLEEISILTNVKQTEFISELKSHILSYPEKEVNNKYIHFLIFERGFKWLFEGEDRNRFYFWTLAPFYSLPFFIYAMNCSEKIKNKFRLYKEFLIRLSPEASAVPHSDLRFPIKSNLKRSLFFTKNAIYSKLPLRFLKFYTKLRNLIITPRRTIEVSSHVETNNSYNFNEQIERCDSIKKYFSIGELQKLKNTNEDKFAYLFTITSAMEQIEETKVANSTTQD